MAFDQFFLSGKRVTKWDGEPFFLYCPPCEAVKNDSAANALLCNIGEGKQCNLLFSTHKFNNHSAKAPPPTHVLGCQCLVVQHWRRQAVQSFELLFSPTAPLCHPQLRKTCSKRAFPRPRAHMHTHGASERAATHTFSTRKPASHLPDILRGLTRTRDHHST